MEDKQTRALRIFSNVVYFIFPLPVAYEIYQGTQESGGGWIDLIIIIGLFAFVYSFLYKPPK